MTLYEINRALMDALDKVDEETGEWLGADDYESLTIAKEEKREHIALYIKNLNAEKDAIAAEIKSFNARKKSLESKIDRLKKLLNDDLQGEKFETARVRVSYRTTHNVVDFDVPEDAFLEWADKRSKKYLNYKPSINKTAIKEALLAGKKIKYCKLVDSQSVVIK